MDRMSVMQFDRQLKLSEIFTDKELRRIENGLADIFETTVKIVGTDKGPTENFERIAILWELEPIGYIEAQGISGRQLKGAVELVTLLIKEAVRYKMASDLHLETKLADYDALQQKHEELLKSEKQYRELSKQLENKVVQQVKAIDEAHVKIFQAEKLASVGQLAAGVAHEINSPLAYIQNNLSTAKEYLQDLKQFQQLFLQGGDPQALQEKWQEIDLEFIMEDFPNLLDDSLQGVKRVAAIVSDLKVFSDINQQKRRMENLNDRIIAVLEMIEPQINENVEICFEPGEIPPVHCYPAHLGQVIFNLIQNGAEAIEGRGLVHISTSLEKDQILISVMDTGSGIDEAVQSRIFDPFFTTKEVGKGTGLGLSIMNDVMKSHHGRVEVKSRLGKGSTFTLFIPVNQL